MKKILLVTAITALVASPVLADQFGRNTNRVSGEVVASRALNTGVNALTATIGTAYTFANPAVKVYANTSYEVVGKTWAGVNVGAVYNVNKSVFVDGYVNYNSGVTTVNLAAGFHF